MKEAFATPFILRTTGVNSLLKYRSQSFLLLRLEKSNHAIV
jgi:hypothetical protein